MATDTPIFIPHPKQEEMLQAYEDEVFAGGARGGGKSAAMAYDAAYKYRTTLPDGTIKVSVDYPEYRALLIRRNYVDLERNFKPICDVIYKPYNAVWKERERAYTFPSGAKIHLVHMENANAIDNYIGGNYHYLGVEEANQFPESWIEKLKSSVRSANPELKALKRYTSNPGGIGHLWLKKYFYDTCPPINEGTAHDDVYDVDYPILKTGNVYIDENGNSRKFIPALVFDNPSLYKNDPSYINNLKSIRDPTLKSMWLLGSWEAQTGAFFNEWSPLHHIISSDEFKLNKEANRIYRAIDYGVSNPFACVFLQVSPSGHITIFDEIYKTNLVPSEQAKEILRVSKMWGLSEEDFDLTICDPAMRAKTHEYLGQRASVVDIYMENGMKNIHFGNNDRVPGWQTFREYLHVPDYVEGDVMASRPYLVFTDTCIKCIETIPELIRSLKNPEDIDTLSDDHCVVGDTLIETVNGRVPIKELVGKDGYCFGYNEKEKRIGATWFSNVRLTRKQTEIWRLELDDGSYLRATPDHLIMLRNGDYVELQNLKGGESLMPFYSNVDYHGHQLVNLNNGVGRWSKQRMVYEDIKGHIENNWTNNVHHIDEDKNNNHPDNLVLMTRAEHCAYHAKRRKNPEEKTRQKMRENMKRRYLKEEYKKRNKAQLSDIRTKASEWHGSPEGIEWHKQHAQKHGFGKHERTEMECPVCHKKFMGMFNNIFCGLNCKMKARTRRLQGVPIDSVFMGFNKDRTPIYTPYNHRVVRVYQDGIEDTYCMTTGFGNFATDTIIIHNCADAIRYLLMFLDKPYLRKQKPQEGWRDRLAKKAKHGNGYNGDLLWCN